MLENPFWLYGLEDCWPFFVTFQAATPPVGLVEVTTLPKLSTATHRLLLGQDTPVRKLEPSTCASFQAVAPPIGLVEVTTLPLVSTATQRTLLGQDTAVSRGPLALGPTEPSTLVTFQATAPPVGLLDETALPWSSIATHRLLLGHDTPTRLIPMIDLGSSTCTGAAQVNSEPGIGDGVGPGVGVGEATVGTGVGLGDGEDWATGRAA